MSGLIVLAFAGLLMQETAPHPSTQAAYQAPAIRPFEPGRNFGRVKYVFTPSPTSTTFPAKSQPMTNG